MSFIHFTVDVDSDGLALVTWNSPGRSMNVLDAAGFKANTPNGHHLVNRTQRDAVYLEIGTRSKHETASYPDVDLVAVRDDAGMRYTRKNGEPCK